MSAASYLHIRSGEDSPERVLPLPGTRARIGRGPQCEIQLDDPSLDEVALVLRRRGSAWHAHAVGPGGVLTIDGVEALGQRRVSRDSTLTVGNYQIRLRYGPSEAGQDETEEAGTVAFSGADGSQTVQDRREERLEKWQASLERRERWLMARKERLKWEKRWRDAGERHRVRAVPPVSAAPVATPVPSMKVKIPAAPVARKAPEPVPPVVERSEPPIAECLSETREGEAPAEPRDPPRPARREANPATEARREPRPPEEARREPRPPEEARREPRPPTEPAPKLGAVTRIESGRLGPPPVENCGVEDSATATPIPETVGASPTPVVSELLDPEALAARWAWEMSGPAPKIKIAFAESRVHTARPPRKTVAPPRDEPLEPERSWPLALPGRVEPAEVLAPPAVEVEVEADSEEDTEIVWPSVAEIMQAHKASEELAGAGRLVTSKVQRLTEERGPASWSVPALVVVPPGLTMALTVLLGGLALGWTWGQDDLAAGQAANRLLSGALVPASGVDLGPLPKDAWWSSTADHLYLYAVAQGRIEDGSEKVDGAQYYLNLARGASPVHPGVLDAQRRVSRAGGDESSVNLVSRDVVTLAREAGQRLRSGDRESGLAMYRRALEMASRSDPEQAQPAQIDSEGQGRRYLLPNEDLYLSVLHGLAADGGDRFADWSAAVPDYAPVLVSAYRAAHRQGRSDSEQALERAVALPVSPAGCSEAEHVAGQAEALAILGRWEESAARYRQAIALSPVREHRRQYWLNLAEIYGRQGDLVKKREALEQAWNAGRAVSEDDEER